MGKKILIVIDVQRCFLDGGLPVAGPDTPEAFANKINKLITEGGFSDVFLTQDVHHPENVSMMNLPMHKNKSNASKYTKIPSGLDLRIGMYKNMPQSQKRRWGGDLTSQVLWPRHCIIRPDDPYFASFRYTGSFGQNEIEAGKVYGSDLAFVLNNYSNPDYEYYMKEPRAKIYHVYKGFDQNKDSYSAIADAVGMEDPFISREDGKSLAPDTSQKFAEKLRQMNSEGEGISDIYVCGIATDYCVFQTTMDLLDFFIFSQTKPQTNKPKIHLIVDLTRAVAATFDPNSAYTGEVRGFLANVEPGAPVEKYFVIETTSSLGMSGGRRGKTRRAHMRGCNCKTCWRKMKGGKRSGSTRKPAGHKKGCKCIICKRR